MMALAVVACREGHTDAHGHEDHEEEEHHHHSFDEIAFSEHQQELFGIATEVAAKSPLSQVIQVGGLVLPSASDDVLISAPASGIIAFDGAALAEGSRVRSGQAVASISYSGLAGANPVVQARTAYETARSEYLRDSAMVIENIVSQSHYEKSRQAYIEAKSAYESVLSRDKGGSLYVKSGAAGYISALFVRSGQYVQAGQAIASVSRNRFVTLRADVPEKYYTALKDIADARFTVPSGEVLSVSGLSGRIIGYGRVAESGYIPMTFEVPGAPSRIWLVGGGSEDLLSVPSGAIVEDQGIYSVFVRDDEDCFMRKVVSLGPTDGIRTVILKGIEEGDEVVTVGAMHIKLASVAAVPAGHHHHH